jgi:hypothetical protein
LVIGQSPPELRDHISASFERGGFALRLIVTAGFAADGKKTVGTSLRDGTKRRCCRSVTVTNDQRSGIAAKQPNSRHVVS